MLRIIPPRPGLPPSPVPNGVWVILFVEYCADTVITQLEGVLERRKFGTPQDEDPSQFVSLFGVILLD